jgi:hypothetical protein
MPSLSWSHENQSARLSTQSEGFWWNFALYPLCILLISLALAVDPIPQSGQLL